MIYFYLGYNWYESLIQTWNQNSNINQYIKIMITKAQFKDINEKISKIFSLIRGIL